MNARAARALRLVAAVSLIWAIVRFVCFVVLRWILWGDARLPYREHFETLARVQGGSALVCMVLTGVGVAMLLAASRARARTLAAVALAAVALQLGLAIFEQIVPQPPRRYDSVLRQALQFVEFIAANGSLVLALLAATPAPRPRAGGQTARTVFFTFVFLLIADGVMSQFAHPTGALGTAFSVAWLAIATTTTVAFAVAAFGLAHHLAAPAGNASLAPGVFPGSWIRDGGPLRLLGRTLIVRAAVGVPLAIIVAVGVGQGAAGAGLLGVIAGCIASVVIAGMMMTALAGQRSFPDGLSDRDALAFAMVIAAIAPLLDIWGAVATGQLLSLVGDARRATSIWNMPSFREIESLEAMASWTGRISIGLGLVGSFAVVRSLAATAHALGDGPQIARAGRVRALLVWGAGAAIATLVVITNVRLRGDEGTVFLLATAGILLSIGIALFVGLLRLAYGLANAIEKPAPPPAPAEISLPAS